MKFNPAISLILIGITLCSCGAANQNETDPVDIDTTNRNTIENETYLDEGITMIDTLPTARFQKAEEEATAKHLEEKYGEQWDFCDCIFKTDSINKAIEGATELTDNDYETLMKRFDVIDQYCKSLLTAPNTTPEQRKRHDKKVRQCKEEYDIL